MFEKFNPSVKSRVLKFHEIYFVKIFHEMCHESFTEYFVFAKN